MPTYPVSCFTCTPHGDLSSLAVISLGSPGLLDQFISTSTCRSPIYSLLTITGGHQAEVEQRERDESHCFKWAVAGLFS